MLQSLPETRNSFPKISIYRTNAAKRSTAWIQSQISFVCSLLVQWYLPLHLFTSFHVPQLLESIRHVSTRRDSLRVECEHDPGCHHMLCIPIKRMEAPEMNLSVW